MLTSLIKLIIQCLYSLTKLIIQRLPSPSTVNNERRSPRNTSTTAGECLPPPSNYYSLRVLTSTLQLHDTETVLRNSLSFKFHITILSMFTYTTAPPPFETLMGWRRVATPLYQTIDTQCTDCPLPRKWLRYQILDTMQMTAQ